MPAKIPITRPGFQLPGLLLAGLLCLLLLSCTAGNLPPSLATPTPDPQLLDRLVGRYSLSGTNPDGSRYRGEASIQWVGNEFQITWVVGEQIYTGAGILERNTLEVKWRSQDSQGFAIYDLNEDGSLLGQWFLNEGQPLGEEMLTPIE